jgi:hypothetical protein
VITLQGAIEKSPILLSQYWKFEWLDGPIIISYFGGSNHIFADCNLKLHSGLNHCAGVLVQDVRAIIFINSRTDVKTEFFCAM